MSLYRDPNQPAVNQPSEIPPQMLEFAQDALRGALQDPDALGRALGEYMTEPKASVWFDANEPAAHRDSQSIRLDRRTKMMFDTRHIFINGESFRAGGRDATLMRRLADERSLALKDVGRASAEAQALLQTWCEAGWLHGL